jgi:hypothetical protein
VSMCGVCGEDSVCVVCRTVPSVQLEARLRRREGRMNAGIKEDIVLILQARVQATYAACFLICVVY